MVKKEQQNREGNLAVSVVIGMGISVAVSLLGAIVITVLTMNEMIADQTIDYCVLALILIASIVGNLVSMLLEKRKLMIISIATSIAFALVLLAITAMFFEGQYHGVAATLLVIIGGGISSMLIVGRAISRPKSYHKTVKL